MQGNCEVEHLLNFALQKPSIASPYAWHPPRLPLHVVPYLPCYACRLPASLQR